MLLRISPCLVPLLRVVFDFDFGWLSAVRSDLAWFACSGSLPCPYDDLSAVFDYISVSSKSFLSSLRAYSVTPFANFDVPKLFPAIAPPIFNLLVCPECNKTFNSLQQLNLHRKRVHDFLHPVHMLIDTVFCPVCLLFFHTRVRALNHIKYRSSICRISLEQLGPSISRDAAVALDLEARPSNRKLYSLGLRAHAASDPVFRLSGPLRAPLFFSAAHGNVHILGNGRRHYS